MANPALDEMKHLIASLQNIAERGEKLARASGGVVSPSHFRAALNAAMFAAGELDSRGLVLPEERRVIGG